MTIDEMQEIVTPTETLHERVSKRTQPVAVYANTQYLGNRVVTRMYPEHYAKVVIARHIWMNYGGSHVQ
jgi:hypothetical protein